MTLDIIEDSPRLAFIHEECENPIVVNHAEHVLTL